MTHGHLQEGAICPINVKTMKKNVAIAQSLVQINQWTLAGISGIESISIGRTWI